jgi:integrase
VLTYEEALVLAKAWFERPEVSSVASDSYPVGSKREMSICPFGEIYSVGHALGAYLEWKLLAATKSNYETLVSLINYHLVPRISHIPINQFDGESFQALAVDVLETPPKFGREDPGRRNRIQSLSQDELRKRKKTFNALVSILRGTFDIAYERGHLVSDRSTRSLRRLPNVDRPRVVFLDRSECRTLVKVSHPDFQNLILAALYTGCRAAELIAMQVGDFTLHTRSIYVASPKGRKTRHVLLPPEAVAFFKKLACGRISGDRLFRKANGRIWGGEYKSYFQKARTDAGLTATVTFHGLRHTYASQLLQNGASIITVADQLGHANTQTVSATYGHLTSQSRADDVDRCFSSILVNDETQDSATVSSETIHQYEELPVFKRASVSSWPLSNNSRFSGTLLAQLRPKDIE